MQSKYLARTNVIVKRILLKKGLLDYTVLQNKRMRRCRVRYIICCGNLSLSKIIGGGGGGGGGGGHPTPPHPFIL